MSDSIEGQVMVQGVEIGQSVDALRLLLSSRMPLEKFASRITNQWGRIVVLDWCSSALPFVPSEVLRRSVDKGPGSEGCSTRR